MPSNSGTTLTKPPYSGPHHYNVKRNGQFGYTDEDGKVHFFGNAAHTGRNYQVVSFDFGGGLIQCKDDCELVDVFTEGGQQTFQPKRGTLLWAVIQDMLAGALN